MTKHQHKAVDALLKQGFRIQFQSDDFYLLYKPDLLTSTIKLVKVDNDGRIETQPLSTILEQGLHE